MFEKDVQSIEREKMKRRDAETEAVMRRLIIMDGEVAQLARARALQA